MDTGWKLPKNAVLTIPEIEAVTQLARAKVGHKFVTLGGPPPRITPGVVNAVFEALLEMLETRRRTT